MATGNPRNKCALQPGHSLMDWIRLGNSGTDLAGNRGIPRPITLAELAKHRTPDDAWMAVHGKCYNVTRYMHFHPGGCDELMRGVGKDATRLFDEVHAWVNYEQMLSKCYLGPLRVPGNFVTSSTPSGDFKLPLLSLAPASTHTSPTRSALTVAAQAARRSASIDKSASLPASPTESPTSERSVVEVLLTAAAASGANGGDGGQTEVPEIVPRFDWMQKSGELLLVFYTRALCNPGWSVQLAEGEKEKDEDEDGAGGARTVTVRVFAQRSVHLFEFVLAHAVRWPCTSKVSFDTGKIELNFRKARAQLWTSFGLLDRRKVTDLAEITTFEYDVVRREPLTPDSWALSLRPRAPVLQYVPVGYHLRIASPAGVSGVVAVERSYTPVPAAFVPKGGGGDGGGEAVEDDVTVVPLLVKRYEGGALSRYLTKEAPLAAAVRLSQPRGAFSLYRTRLHTRVAMLAAGSGLTPMLSVLAYMLERTSNRMESITLLYYNKNETDIWCRKHLEELSQKDKRLHIINYLSATPAPTHWPVAQRGRIAAAHVAPLAEKHSPHHSTYGFVCGPSAFNDECRRLLAAIGLDDGKVHVFH